MSPNVFLREERGQVSEERGNEMLRTMCEETRRTAVAPSSPTPLHHSFFSHSGRFLFPFTSFP